MDLSPVVLSIPIYFLLIGIELIVVFFSKPEYYRLPDTIANISCGIGDQVIGTFVKFLTLGVYQLIYEHYSFLQIEKNLISFIVFFVLVDFIYYWVHRWSHEINFLWAGHVVHHQSEEYNLSVALRQSWFHKFFTFIFYLPLAFLGFDTMSFVLANGLNLLYQFWIHTELIGKLGPLEYVLNTPSHHRVHHGSNPEYIDRNHAGVLIIWDRMFGTFQEEKFKPTYGITQPLNSWNPLWANISQWHTIIQQMAHANGWRQKVAVLLRPPGWANEDSIGNSNTKQIEKKLKFRIHYPKILGYYVVSQFIILLLSTSYFLFFSETLQLENKITAATLIIFSVMNFGLLFERKKIGFLLEIIRIIAFSLFVAWQFHNTQIYLTYLFVSSFIGFLFLCWLIMMHKIFKK